MNKAIEMATKLIKEFEGCRLEAYQDMRGVWTIGWGTTKPAILEFADHASYILPGPGVTWSQLEADRALAETVEKIHHSVCKSTLSLPEPLLPTQLAALTCFVYNVGIGNFLRSGVLRALKVGQLKTAADNLLLWNRVGPYVSHGLTRRREAEKALFLSVPKDSPQQPGK